MFTGGMGNVTHGHMRDGIALTHELLVAQASRR